MNDDDLIARLSEQVDDADIRVLRVLVDVGKMDDEELALRVGMSLDELIGRRAKLMKLGLVEVEIEATTDLTEKAREIVDGWIAALEGAEPLPADFDAIEGWLRERGHVDPDMPQGAPALLMRKWADEALRAFPDGVIEAIRRES